MGWAVPEDGDDSFEEGLPDDNDKDDNNNGGNLVDGLQNSDLFDKLVKKPLISDNED